MSNTKKVELPVDKSIQDLQQQYAHVLMKLGELEVTKKSIDVQILAVYKDIDNLQKKHQELKVRQSVAEVTKGGNDTPNEELNLDEAV